MEKANETTVGIYCETLDFPDRVFGGSKSGEATNLEAGSAADHISTNSRIYWCSCHKMTFGNFQVKHAVASGCTESTASCFEVPRLPVRSF